MSARDEVEALERDIGRLERKLDRAETKIEKARAELGASLRLEEGSDNRDYVKRAITILNGAS